MIFLIVIVPILFVMLVWVATSVYRILQPDDPIPVLPDISELPDLPAGVLYAHDPVRSPEVVGARIIRELGRRGSRNESLTSPYDFLDGHSDGFPEVWWQDVVRRRN